MMRRALAFIRAVMVLAVVAVVAPAALASASDRRFGGRLPFHGVPAPSAWNVDHLKDALTSRLAEQTVADLMIRLSLVLAWSAVAVFLLTVIVETAHMARHAGHHLPDVRGLAWSQRGARTVAAGLLALVPMLSVHEPAVAAEAGDAGLLRDLSRAAGPAALVEAMPPAFEAETASPAAPVALADDYIVRPGDSVYGIARRAVGPDPTAIAAYADRIVEANLGREMGTGERFTNPGYIDVGWVLTLPPAGVAHAGADRDVSEHTVVIGESLWSIADDELGAGALWPELYRANEGHVFADGRVLTDPAMLRPGWTLAIPHTADELPLVEAPAQDDKTVAVTSDPATEPEAGVEKPAAAPAPASRPAIAVDHDAHHDVGLVVASPIDVIDEIGEGGELDGQLAGRLERRSVNEWTDRDGPSIGAASQADPDPPSGESIADDSSPQLITLRRAAMLAGGVLTLLAVRRRRRLREARPRARLPEPHTRVGATERALRVAGEGGRLARVDIAIRAATLSLIASGQRVLAVLCSPDGELELIATGPVTLPSVWRRGGDRWTLPATVPIEMLAGDARQVAAPCPALVQVGIDDRDRHVYIDLEAIGALEVGGDGAQGDAIVAAIAATLAGSVLAEVTPLVSVGVPADAFLGHRLHDTAPDVEAACSLARHAIGASTPGDRSRFELRARGTSGEAWEPAVVLVASGVGPVAPPDPGVALVSASPIHGPSSVLAPDGDAWVLRPAGLRFHPIGLVPDEVSAIGELVALDDDRTIYAADEAADGSPASPHRLEWDLLVRLFGQVAVVDRDGSRVDFERSKAAELVAWLATHRDRATRSDARAVLWEHDVRDATFATVLSEARRSLGRLVPPPTGHEWIGRTLSDALPLHERVRTDADVLEQALAAARLQTPAEAIETLRGPVEAIAGVPFQGASYLWADDEGLTSNLILLATTAAAELAEHCLSVGDIEGVFRATGRGLRVLPGHEELIGLRMRAHGHAGDHAGVRQEWNSYERVVNADPWSDGEPSPKLVELRKELLKPSI